MDRKPIMNQEAKKITFDPTKNYQWDVDDMFTVTGAEIDAWNKALSIATQDPEFQKFTYIYRAKLLMEKFIKEAVESNVIREAPKPVETDEQPVEQAS